MILAPIFHVEGEEVLMWGERCASSPRNPKLSASLERGGEAFGHFLYKRAMQNIHRLGALCAVAVPPYMDAPDLPLAGLFGIFPHMHMRARIYIYICVCVYRRQYLSENKKCKSERRSERTTE